MNGKTRSNEGAAHGAAKAINGAVRTIVNMFGVRAVGDQPKNRLRAVLKQVKERVSTLEKENIELERENRDLRKKNRKGKWVGIGVGIAIGLALILATVALLAQL